MAILGIQGHDSHGLVAAESRIFRGALVLLGGHMNIANNLILI